MKKIGWIAGFFLVTLVFSWPCHGQEWAITYGGGSSEGASSILETADGGCIVAGWTSSFGAGDYDIWALKLSEGGNVLWQKTYGGASDNETANLIKQTNDGGYILSGQTASFGVGLSDIWVLKLRDDGSVSSIDVNTSITPADTNATLTDTSVKPADTFATVMDTTADVLDTEAERQLQSP